MSAPRDLLIVGTGGQAKELAQLARQIDPGGARWTAIRYVAQSQEQMGDQLPYGQVTYTDAEVDALELACDVAIGVGDPTTRRRIARRLAERRALQFPNLVHPSVEIDPQHVRVGRGNIFAKGVVLTCDITIGDFNLLNWNVTIGHDARIGSFNVVNPGCNISGYTTIGDACLLGTGCQVLERLTVASEVRIGAGAVLTRSVGSGGGTYVGIPARLAQ